jgi:uncharacterized protein (DUF2252 family)
MHLDSATPSSACRVSSAKDGRSGCVRANDVTGGGEAVDIIEATRSYERWLGEQIPVAQDDLATKHEKMDGDAFTFFRATHYRFLQRALELAPELDGPRLPCVGDLHVENFGTWRDAEGRLVWGVNDLDESETLSYALDLACLATSAALAIDAGSLQLSPDDAADAILTGYGDALRAGGDAFVLAGDQDRLAELVDDALPDADRCARRSSACSATAS